MIKKTRPIFNTDSRHQLDDRRSPESNEVVMRSQESNRSDQLTELERLREAGDYGTLADRLPADWQSWDISDRQTVRLRLLVVDLNDRQGDVVGMRLALEPYINLNDLVHVGHADRLLVAD